MHKEGAAFIKKASVKTSNNTWVQGESQISNRTAIYF